MHLDSILSRVNVSNYLSFVGKVTAIFCSVVSKVTQRISDCFNNFICRSISSSSRNTFSMASGPIFYHQSTSVSGFKLNGILEIFIPREEVSVTIINKCFTNTLITYTLNTLRIVDPLPSTRMVVQVYHYPDNSNNRILYSKCPKLSIFVIHT
jgi:hypothetical protein